MITLEQAQQLKVGDEVHFDSCSFYQGKPLINQWFVEMLAPHEHEKCLVVWLTRPDGRWHNVSIVIDYDDPVSSVYHLPKDCPCRKII